MKNSKQLNSEEPVVRRNFTEPALGEKLLEQVLCNENVKRAWEQVKRNQGAPGIDGVSVEEFEAYARDHWRVIRQAIREGKYRPQPVKRCFIPKQNGGSRPLGIPTVMDRVIQQAVAQILEPIFDPEFSESSFGFRRGRSAHDAVKQVASYIGEGNNIAIEVDLKSFFDEVDHDMLMNRVSRKVRDKSVLRLIGSYLRAGVSVDGVIEETRKGVPQGGPLSPLLANILLDDLDKELEKRGHKFARYADDFVIMVRSQWAGNRVKESITRFLEKKLKLKVNNEKSKAGHNSKCEFLGFSFYRGGTIKVTSKSIEHFKHRIRELTGRSQGISMAQRIVKLNRYIRGWMGYFKLSKYYVPIPGLDEWIRRRIRMCYWKQWRYARRKITELTKRGAPLSSAIRAALSARSYWALSQNLATRMGLTNQYLHQTLGLVSIRDLWTSFHYPS